MLKNKFHINIKYLKKLFSLLIVFFIIYSTFMILDNNFLIITVSGRPGPPVISNPIPSNGTTDISISLSSLSVDISDPEGDLIDWDIQTSPNVGSNSGSGQTSFEYFTFTTESGDPPQITNPIPSNGTTDISISLSSLSVDISDPEGDLIDWDIQTSPNVGSNSGSGPTDPSGSGKTTHNWYYFTTETQNFPSVISNPNPTNGSTNQLLSFTWSISISDPDGDVFDWTVQCSNGQSDGGSGSSNDTKSLSLTGLSYFTVYTVWVNATDPGGSGLYTRSWYTFMTTAGQSPVFGTPSPTNGSNNQNFSFTWSVLISDPDGDSFNWTIQCSNGQSSNANGSSNGTKSLSLSGLLYSTTYTVWVNATDSYNTARAWFSFTTRDAASVPTDFKATDVGTNQIDLSWTIGTYCDRTYIEWNSFAGWSLGGGTELYNDSGTSTSHSGLDPHTMYYYQAWGWNETYKLHSNGYAADNDTTWDYTPSFDNPSHSNGSTVYVLSLTWSIYIFDRDGDTFNWSIECSNGQNNSAIGASNETKSLSISGLDYNIWGECD